MIQGKQVYQSEKVAVKSEDISGIEKYLETHNLGNRGIEDGDSRKQLVGLLGENIIVEKLTGQKIDFETKTDGFDGGFDLTYKEKRIDVKTMERSSYVRGEFVNNFYTMQEGYKADIIVFCSYNKKEQVLEICGWIYKSELSTRGIFYKKGTVRTRADKTTFTFRQDNYEVENKNLRPFKELLSL